jgi:hypothetical protein
MHRNLFFIMVKMKYFWGQASLWIAILSSLILAQNAFEVIELEGSAKAQRVQKQKWEKISVGTRLSDNDIIETYFQTKISIKLTDGTIVLFGSNSKVLINISYKEIAGRKTTNASFSLFSGGMLAKAIDKAKISIFTTNAVGEIDSGTLAVVADSKSGETGFLGIGGKSAVRNISQQKGMDLEAGYTTIVIPGREPAPPLSLSFRHAAILRHFFGDKLITDELRASSITPANDQTSLGNRATVTEGTGNEKTRTDLLSYKKVFNLKHIYGSIIDDRENNERFYRPLIRPVFSEDAQGSTDLLCNFGFSDSSIFLTTLLPKFRMPYVEAGLRFEVGYDYRYKLVTGFNSLPALLDKIEHVTAGSVEDSTYVTAGTLYDITFGNGLMLKHFNNSSNNRLYHPLGVAGKLKLFDQLTVNALLSDVSSPSLLGMHAAWDLSYYTFGAGYYYDFNQYFHLRDSTDMRYTRYRGSGIVYPDTQKFSGRAAIYEFNLCTSVAEYYNFSMRALFDFAQKREGGMNDGWVGRPFITMAWPFYTVTSGIIIENGRLISGEFDEFYSSRHAWLKHGPVTDTILSINTALDKKRLVNSLFLSLQANPLKTLDIDFTYTQALLSKNATAFRVSDTAPDSVKARTVNSPLDFSFDFRCAVNDKLIPYVKYAAVSMRQSHGLLYPERGGFMSSWNSEAGFECISRPLFANLSITLGGRLFYIDKGPYPNDALDAKDKVFELSGGVRWDFL